MKEKWNRKIVISGAELSEAEILQDKKFLKKNVAGAKDHPLEELIKTGAEIKIISDLQGAYLKLFRLLRLSEQDIDIDNIHIITTASFEAYRGKESGGFTINSQVFIPRSEKLKPDVFAHELAHAFSFSRDIFDAKISQNSQGHKAISYSNKYTKRAGYHFKHPASEQYLGINEAITEIVAGKVVALLQNEDAEDMVNLIELRMKATAYIPQIILMERIVYRYEDMGGNIDELWNEIYKGYFTGDMKWINKLKIIHPDISRILRDMSKTDEAALQAAHDLGITEAIEPMRSYFK